MKIFFVLARNEMTWQSQGMPLGPDAFEFWVTTKVRAVLLAIALSHPGAHAQPAPRNDRVFSIIQ